MGKGVMFTVKVIGLWDTADTEHIILEAIILLHLLNNRLPSHSMYVINRQLQRKAVLLFSPLSVSLDRQVDVTTPEETLNVLKMPIGYDF